jgi:ElaB/YqjD/DUF883 family membrane-anchored ribosome-binding protein
MTEAQHTLEELIKLMKYHGDEASPEAEQLRNELYKAMERLYARNNIQRGF